MEERYWFNADPIAFVAALRFASLAEQLMHVGKLPLLVAEQVCLGEIRANARRLGERGGQARKD